MLESNHIRENPRPHSHLWLDTCPDAFSSKDIGPRQSPLGHPVSLSSEWSAVPLTEVLLACLWTIPPPKAPQQSLYYTIQAQTEKLSYLWENHSNFLWILSAPENEIWAQRDPSLVCVSQSTRTESHMGSCCPIHSFTAYWINTISYNHVKHWPCWRKAESHSKSSWPTQGNT